MEDSMQQLGAGYPCMPSVMALSMSLFAAGVLVNVCVCSARKFTWNTSKYVSPRPELVTETDLQQRESERWRGLNSDQAINSRHAFPKTIRLGGPSDSWVIVWYARSQMLDWQYVKRQSGCSSWSRNIFKKKKKRFLKGEADHRGISARSLCSPASTSRSGPEIWTNIAGRFSALRRDDDKGYLRPRAGNQERHRWIEWKTHIFICLFATRVQSTMLQRWPHGVRLCFFHCAIIKADCSLIG